MTESQVCPVSNLIRTSKLSSNFIRNNIHTINKPIKVIIDSNFIEMSKDLTPEEVKSGRRLVVLELTQEDNSTFRIDSRKAESSSAPRKPNQLIISCILWKDANECVVTSVDILLVLEALVNETFSVEEKSRIRRNLQSLKPFTVTRKSANELFKSVMAMDNPKPRNIEKDLKVFKWSQFVDAVSKVMSKYSSNPAVSVHPGALSEDKHAHDSGEFNQPTFTSTPWSFPGKYLQSEHMLQPRPRKTIIPSCKCKYQALSTHGLCHMESTTEQLTTKQSIPV